jgi:hypothetical protein
VSETQCFGAKLIYIRGLPKISPNSITQLSITHTFLLLSSVRDTHAHLMWELREVRRTAASSMLQQDEDKAIKTSRRNSIFRCTNDCHGVGSIKKKKRSFFKKVIFCNSTHFAMAYVFSCDIWVTRTWQLNQPSYKKTNISWHGPVDLDIGPYSRVHGKCHDGFPCVDTF